MATIVLPAVADAAAAIFARAGLAMLQRLANVSGTLDGTAIAGQLLDDAALPNLGGLAVQSNNLRLNVYTGDLPAGAGVGSVLVIATGQRAGTYSVQLLTPQDDLGLTTLQLERA